MDEETPNWEIVDEWGDIIDYEDPEFQEFMEGQVSHRRDKGFLDRVVEEILDPVDFYWAGEGPEGPWYFRSLTVYRIMNNIQICDVDAVPIDNLEVPEGLDQIEDAAIRHRLKRKLDRINKESLAAL